MSRNCQFIDYEAELDRIVNNLCEVLGEKDQSGDKTSVEIICNILTLVADLRYRSKMSKLDIIVTTINLSKTHGWEM